MGRIDVVLWALRTGLGQVWEEAHPTFSVASHWDAVGCFARSRTTFGSTPTGNTDVSSAWANFHLARFRIKAILLSGLVFNFILLIKSFKYFRRCAMKTKLRFAYFICLEQVLRLQS